MPKPAGAPTADILPDFERFVVRRLQHSGCDIESSFEDWDDTSDITPQGDWYVTRYYDPGFRQYVKACLGKLAALPHNWDSYGAPKISRRVISAAHTLVDRLPEHIAPRPSIVPMSSGKIQFEWDVGHRAVELEIESSGQIHYLRWDPTNHIEEEGVYPLADMDRSINHIRWVCAGSRYA